METQERTASEQHDLSSYSQLLLQTIPDVRESPLADPASPASVLLPLSIFQNDVLSGLEAVTKYLRENSSLRCCEIAKLLNRSQKTIWDAYQSSQQKMQKQFAFASAGHGTSIPSQVLCDRSVGVLESIVEFLRDELNLRYCTIALLVNRNQRTVWTVYQRAKKKRNVKRGSYGSA